MQQCTVSSNKGLFTWSWGTPVRWCNPLRCSLRCMVVLSDTLLSNEAAKCAWSAHEQAAKLAVSLLSLTFITLNAKPKNPHATPASLGAVTRHMLPHLSGGPQLPCKQALSLISMYCVITLFVCPWAKCYSIYCRYICIYCRYIGAKTIFAENKICQELCKCYYTIHTN